MVASKKKFVMTIEPDGTVFCIMPKDEKFLALSGLFNDQEMRRVSNICFDPNQKNFYIQLVDGTILDGRYKTYDLAVEAEVDYIQGYEKTSPGYFEQLFLKAK